jgi:hypothetical protein
MAGSIPPDTAPFEVALPGYNLLVLPDELPSLYYEYTARARLADQLTVEERVTDDERPRFAFVAVGQTGAWPFLVVVFRYRPSGGSGSCGAALVPEQRRLFLGAGERLVAYDLDPAAPRRLWEDTADFGFAGWQVHGDVVVMSAELELAAWDATATKLWSRFVEPPWEYHVEGDDIVLDVMGEVSRFPLRSGPDGHTPH